MRVWTRILDTCSSATGAVSRRFLELEFELGSCDAVDSEACDYGAFDGDSSLSGALPRIPRRNSLNHRGSLVVIFLGKQQNPKTQRERPDDGCRAHVLFISLAAVDRALSTSSRPQNVPAHPRTDCEANRGRFAAPFDRARVAPLFSLKNPALLVRFPPTVARLAVPKR